MYRVQTKVREEKDNEKSQRHLETNIKHMTVQNIPTFDQIIQR